MFKSSGKAAESHTLSAHIGKDIKISGDIDSEQEIHLSGTVVGNVSSPRIVVLASGSVDGNISSQSAVISGTVTGDIKTGQLSIEATASIRGTLHFADIEISQGADVEGQFIRSEPDANDKDNLQQSDNA